MQKFKFNIGSKIIGDGNILLQSMSDKKTSDVDYQVKFVNDLEKQGLDLMRFSVLDESDIDALKEIKKQVNIPIIADIHFNHLFALKAIEAGVDKIRINPGNIGSESNIRNIINLCKKKNVPIRIGVNSGSLNKFKGKTDSFISDYFLALDETLNVFKNENFNNIVLSLKSSDVKTTQELYFKAASIYPYPLHIGLTESGFSVQGAIKSALALAPLLSNNIGDTIRLSLASDRKEEIRSIKTLLKETGRRKNLPQFIVCPTCGRTQIELKKLSILIADHLDYVFKDIKVALMGCPVNGLGEAKDADIGLTGSGQEDSYMLFSKGKPLGIFSFSKALEKLFEYIDNF